MNLSDLNSTNVDTTYYNRCLSYLLGMLIIIGLNLLGVLTLLLPFLYILTEEGYSESCPSDYEGYYYTFLISLGIIGLNLLCHIVLWVILDIRVNRSKYVRLNKHIILIWVVSTSITSIITMFAYMTYVIMASHYTDCTGKNHKNLDDNSFYIAAGIGWVTSVTQIGIALIPCFCDL